MSQCPISRGVPQGSLLFHRDFYPLHQRLAYSHISPYEPSFMYSDDTVIVTASKSPEVDAFIALASTFQPAVATTLSSITIKRSSCSLKLEGWQCRSARSPNAELYFTSRLSDWWWSHLAWTCGFPLPPAQQYYLYNWEDFRNRYAGGYVGCLPCNVWEQYRQYMELCHGVALWSTQPSPKSVA